MTAEASALRIDKWLWYARFFKTRGVSSKLVSSGKIRVNSEPVGKPAYQVKPGDVLTFPQEKDIRVIQIDALGERRGPATEAAELYTDLSPPEKKNGRMFRKTRNSREKVVQPRKTADKLTLLVADVLIDTAKHNNTCPS